MTKIRVQLNVVAALMGSFAAGAGAQSFPTKPVRIVVPLAPGGNVDITMRSFAPRLTELLGQQVIIENRPGASSAIGTEHVARSAPDGYTLLAVANTLVLTPGLVAKVGYDPVKDFAGITLTATLPQALVLHPSVPARSVKELIALAKARPKELINATQGEAATGRYAAELFADATGAQFLHVPYKGGGPALVDLVGGQVSLMFATVSTVLPYVKADRLRALALTSAKRSSAFPGIPTVAESGVPGYEAIIFNGIVVPAATPADLRARLHRDLVRVLSAQELRARFLDLGVEIASSESPDHFSEYIRTEAERFNLLWRRLGLRPR